VPGESGAETFILCRSADRVSKERAMRERFEKRIETGLVALRKTCEKRRCDPGVVERRVGGCWALTRARRACSTCKSREAERRRVLNWSRRTAALESASAAKVATCCGATSLIGRPPSCGSLYPTDEAEAAFRIQKDNLRLRPVWHHTAERVQATSWSASWPTCCARPWRVGPRRPVW